MARVWVHILWSPQWLHDAPIHVLVHVLVGLLPWGLCKWYYQHDTPIHLLHLLPWGLCKWSLLLLKRRCDWGTYVFFDGARYGSV